MKIGNKKASTFVYILILINLAFILSVVIMNNSYILNNKMNVWFGNKNLFSNIQNKWEIAINSVKFYNSNWNGFDDSFSCPQSITMSGTFSTWSLKETWINTSWFFENWSIWCIWTYNWNEFKIYLNKDNLTFNQAKYEWEYLEITNPSTYYWETESTFSDSDLTLMYFDDTWTHWWDNVDDDFNSDDYMVTSSSWVYYLSWYQDDDVIPRLTYFGNVWSGDNLYNIYWSNSKINEVIDENTNNLDSLNMKAGDVENAYLYLDLASSGNYLYDLKVVEFNKDSYDLDYSLYTVWAYNWKNLDEKEWYIQKVIKATSLSKNITWNEFVFDLKNKDYAVFISNSSDEDLSYKLRAETASWTWIYINPINDSLSWTIEVLVNDLIYSINWNYIWDHFKITWEK